MGACGWTTTSRPPSRLYAIGEANFSDHDRLGASSLMQCLADGYFILPQTIGDGLQPLYRDKVDTTHPAFARTEAEVRDRIQRVMSIKGDSTPLSIHKRLGKVIWNNCGMSRNAEDLASALDQVDQLKKEFWENVNIPGTDGDVNQTLERALRLVDFLEIGELMCHPHARRELWLGGPRGRRRRGPQRREPRRRLGVDRGGLGERAPRGTATRGQQPATRSYK